MKRQSIIVILQMCDFRLECFGNFKKMCEAKEFPYHSLKMKDLPIEYNGWKIERVPFN